MYSFVGPTIASVFQSIQPIATILLAVVTIGQYPTAIQYYGTALIFAGMWGVLYIGAKENSKPQVQSITDIEVASQTAEPASAPHKSDTSTEMTLMSDYLHHQTPNSSGLIDDLAIKDPSPKGL